MAVRVHTTRHCIRIRCTMHMSHDHHTTSHRSHDHHMTHLWLGGSTVSSSPDDKHTQFDRWVQMWQSTLQGGWKPNGEEVKGNGVGSWGWWE